MTEMSERIKARIYTLRGVQVMLDSDLAILYNIQVKRLNEQVRRNITRFPESFMFQLSESEVMALRSQIATLEKGRGTHRKYRPYVFTEQGVAMLSGVLNSDVAVKVSVQIIEAFVAMRRFIASNGQVFYRLDKLFQAIETKGIKPEKGIFFESKVFDLFAKRLQYVK
jgi:hypothetical protein